MAIFSKSGTSLIAEIQSEVSSRNTDLSETLRKALLVAKKLGLRDLSKWVSNELSGYGQDSNCPNYRKIKSSLKIYNPYNGLIPFIINSNDMEQTLSMVEVPDSVGSLEALLRENEGHILEYPFNGEQVTLIKKMAKIPNQMLPTRVISASQIENILEGVTNQLLELTIELESNGIVGEGMSFSKEEKEKAGKLQNINIDNFQGILGNVSDSTVNQTNEMKVVKNDFDSLANHLNEVGVPFSDIKELEIAVNNDGDISANQSSGFGSNVSHWIGNMVTKASSGTWDISIATAANVLGTAISKYYGIT